MIIYNGQKNIVNHWLLLWGKDPKYHNELDQKLIEMYETMSTKMKQKLHLRC